MAEREREPVREQEPVRERDTVVVEGDRRSSYGWLIGLAIAALLILLFFMFGGMSLFDGTNNGTDTINVDTPDNVQVEPPTGQ